MSNRRHDYGVLEREYVTSDISLRELARNHGITHSLVMEQSVKRDWTRKRAEYRSDVVNKSITFTGNAEADRRVREGQVRDHAIEIIDQALTKLGEDMKATRRVLVGDQFVEEPVMRLRPQEIALLIDRFQVLFGKPSQITEERSLGVSIEAGVGPDVLRGFIEATRGLGADTGAAHDSPLPRAGGARKN